MEVFGYVYKIENIINGKIYIGVTRRTFKERYNNNVFKYTHNEHLKRSFEKYGEKNFKVIEKFDVAYSEDELNKKEKYWIEFYNSIDPKYGYNKCIGGNSSLQWNRIGNRFILNLDTLELYKSKRELSTLIGIHINYNFEMLDEFKSYNFIVKNNRYSYVYKDGSFFDFYENNNNNYLFYEHNIKNTSAYIDFLELTHELDDNYSLDFSEENCHDYIYSNDNKKIIVCENGSIINYVKDDYDEIFFF